MYINPPDSPPFFKINPIQVAIVHVNSFPSHDLFPEAAVPRAVKVAGLVVNTNMFLLNIKWEIHEKREKSRVNDYIYFKYIHIYI